MAHKDQADFDVWLARVDRIVTGRIGLGIDDLPDKPFWDCFTDGLTPREMALEILEEEAPFALD